MARQSGLVSLVVAFFTLLHFATALQVTPNSPCTEFCIDSPDADVSDPDSSNTDNKDIVCSDKDYKSKPNGQKFQRCLSCLQDSGYSKDDESDQRWFFYNLRYAFDFCILGYPNVTDFSISPCVTSEACGTLQSALTDGLEDPAYAQPYDYCDKGGKSLTGDKIEQCASCVRAVHEQTYLANFITAISAGCEQKRANGNLVGLDSTVFTTATLSIVKPSTTSSTDSSKSLQLSPPIIAGIAIGGLVFILLIAGCTFMQVRKRRNRQARLRRASPMSFVCQTHVTPRTPNFPTVIEEEDEDELDQHGNGRGDGNEKTVYMDPSVALRSNPVQREVNEKEQMMAAINSVLAPPPVHSSPNFASPVDHFKTPTSTTSVRSNVPLLTSSFSTYKPYVPSEHQPPAAHEYSTTPGLAISTSEASPYANQYHQQGGIPDASTKQGLRVTTRWEKYGGPKSPRRNGKGSSPGSPVSFSNIQTSFPPPPTQKRR